MVDLWFANMSVTRDHMPWSPQYTQRNQGQKRCNTDLKFHMWWFKSGKTSISCPETSSLLWFMTMTIQKCVETGWNLLGSWPVELMVGTFGEPLAQPFGMKMVRCHKATGMVGRFFIFLNHVLNHWIAFSFVFDSCPLTDTKHVVSYCGLRLNMPQFIPTDRGFEAGVSAARADVYRIL
jgi:hypothetical protein